MGQLYFIVPIGDTFLRISLNQKVFNFFSLVVITVKRLIYTGSK